MNKLKLFSNEEFLEGTLIPSEVIRNGVSIDVIVATDKVNMLTDKEILEKAIRIVEDSINLSNINKTKGLLNSKHKPNGASKEQVITYLQGVISTKR